VGSLVPAPSPCVSFLFDSSVEDCHLLPVLLGLFWGLPGDLTAAGISGAGPSVPVVSVHCLSLVLGCNVSNLSTAHNV
jgi:hypothetical protein